MEKKSNTRTRTWDFKFVPIQTDFDLQTRSVVFNMNNTARLNNSERLEYLMNL